MGGAASVPAEDTTPASGGSSSSSFLGGLGEKLGGLLPFGKTTSNENKDQAEQSTEHVPLVGGRRICRRNRKNKRLTRRSPMRSKSKKRQSLRNK